MRFPIRITDNFLLEPVMHAFGVGAESSYVEVAGNRLVVSMGRWFAHDFPLADVARFGPSDWPWWGGLGVKLHHHGVGVVGSTEGVVNIQFKSIQKVTTLFVVECEQVWVSVVNPPAFFTALKEATGLAPEPHLPF